MTLTKLKVRMNQSRFNLKQIALLTICSILLALSTPVMAKKDKTPPPVKPKISAVIVDSETDPAITSITIFGSEFLTPEVDLGIWGPLTILTSTDTQIDAVSLTSIPAGDYKLVVSQGNNGKQQDDYDLTIGAVGPTGATGENGIGLDGAPCSISSCDLLGQATITCGDNTVTIACILPGGGPIVVGFCDSVPQPGPECFCRDNGLGPVWICLEGE